MGKLGDYVKIRTGKLDANASSPNGAYPFFTCAVEPLKIDSFSYDCECVLVAGNGDLNVKYYNGKFDAYQRTYIIESKDKAVLTVPYLYSFLARYVETLRAESIGGVIKYIKLGNLTEAKINLPSVKEQNKIVAILEKAKMLVQLRRQQLAALDELVKARFVEMFGDPESNPNRYPIKMIGSLLKDIIPGWSANGESRQKMDDEKAVLKVSAVTQGYFKPEEHKALPADMEIKKYVYPHKGDLLFSRANTRELVGATAIIEEDYPDLLLPDKLWRVLFSDNLNVYYAKYVLSTDSIRAEFSAQSTGTSGSMFNVSAEKFRKIGIPVPPIEYQNEFEAFIHQVDKSKTVVQKALDETQLLFDSLMQRYFG